MEALIAQAIKDTIVSRKTSVPWNPDEPYLQSYYTFDDSNSSWVARSPTIEVSRVSTRSADITNIALYTWNIDFMLPFAEARMKSALAYLGDLTSPQNLSSTTAPVIFLQECTPSDLATIAATLWVRERFHLTDVDSSNWATTHYGTTMLVDSRLPITAAFRVHYSKTRMDRDALFVDVSLTNSSSSGSGKKVRLCNTHLESMAFDPPFRPPQMQLVAGYMHEKEVHTALAAGDFNAIQPFDRTLHVDNNLNDAFLELGGKEDTDEGFTWGQQAATKLREQFGCSRMDKVYFRGDAKLVKFQRFGEDVLVEGERESREIIELGFEKPWVTDHLGVMAEVKIVSSS
ncbi:Endonuclease/exonuclease/phosphatase [Annulohypoxylon stygium]|nr:Endonuclease/exonuclease/phosphatase [Annulohypoxylon stygium]